MGEFTSTGRELFYKFVQKIGKKCLEEKRKKNAQQQPLIMTMTGLLPVHVIKRKLKNNFLNNI